VKFELNGFGENENESPFENKTPEERSYNRTVIIDIVPTINVSNNKLIFKFRKEDRQQSILFFFIFNL
jgi:hypothetical protein